MFWCSELLTYLECAGKFVICLFLLTPHKHTPFHHSLCSREFNRRESVRWLILGGTCPVRVHFFRNCLTHAEGPAVIVANRVKLLPIDKFPDGTIKEIISYCTISGCTASQCIVSYCIVLHRNVSYHIISYGIVPYYYTAMIQYDTILRIVLYHSVLLLSSVSLQNSESRWASIQVVKKAYT